MKTEKIEVSYDFRNLMVEIPVEDLTPEGREALETLLSWGPPGSCVKCRLAWPEPLAEAPSATTVSTHLQNLVTSERARKAAELRIKLDVWEIDLPPAKLVPSAYDTRGYAPELAERVEALHARIAEQDN
jgi:hypothetical protein